MRRLVRRGRLSGWRALAAILTLLLTAATLGPGSPPAHAQGGGIPLPTEFGTVWEIVAGYNTPTHSVADQNDPHAIDIVRADGGDTTGSRVLSPIAGTISYVDYSDCLTIDNGAGLAVLLCHIFPDGSLSRGVRVQVGEYLGTVAPAGYANNGGLPHIHIAVHHTRGGGYLDGTIPLTGQWAVEGEDLPATGEYNAYQGRRFTSSNRSGGSLSPAPAPDPAPAPAPAPTPTPGRVPLEPGWNMVGWTSHTFIADIAGMLEYYLDGIYVFDAQTQRFGSFRPGHLTRDDYQTEVRPGDGLLIRIKDVHGLVLSRPASVEPRRLNLRAGYNLVAWTGAATTVEEAMRSLGDALAAAFWWDAAAQKYRTYRPGLPMVSDLSRVAPAQALWLLLDADAVWDPGVATPIDPPPGDVPAAPGGELLEVVGFSCLHLRSAPGTGAMSITCLQGGTVLQSLGEPEVHADGHDWVKVRVNGQIGWVARGFTRPYQTAAPGDNSGSDPGGPPANAVAGDATYYHHSLAGNVMYCGGRYNPDDPTIAASTTHECGAKLRVWRGTRYVDVTVQDTGAFPLNDIDLSPAAFRQIGTLPEGRIRVRIEVLALPGR